MMNYADYLREFTLKDTGIMKCGTDKLVEMIANDEAVLLDIRMPGEYEAWHFGFGLHIPLNELPDRLDELPTDKIIVAACPHNDRANMARQFLHLHGYQAKYLSAGMLDLASRLRNVMAEDWKPKK